MLELSPLVTRVLRTRHQTQSVWVEPDYYHQNGIKMGSYAMCTRYVEIFKPLFF